MWRDEYFLDDTQYKEHGQSTIEISGEEIECLNDCIHNSIYTKLRY